LRRYEKALEAIQDAFDNRQITTQGAIERIEKLIDELLNLNREK